LTFARIAGLGQWLPDRVRHNTEWPESFVEASRNRHGDRILVDLRFEDERDPARALAMRHLALEAGDPFLGCRERRVADASVGSARAEAFAAQSALSDASVEGAEVDVVLSSALVPDRLMPSNACRVAHSIGAPRAWASTLDAACASPVVQLATAAALIESGRARVVLLTQSHLASRTFPLGHPASPCVGDAAAAMVVVASETPGIESTHAVTHGEFYDAVLWCRGKTPESDPPWWEAGGPFFMGSHDSSATRELMHDTVPIAARTVRELSAQAHFDVERIDVLACVQPRRWVPGAVAEALGLSPEVAPQTYERLAHLGGVGPVVNLIAAREAGLLRPGARVVLYAQGAGFTRAAASFQW
jgi:3-oxoacyl-[acyl-carrier-protein] synthase III